jgi:hypothetical protein
MKCAITDVLKWPLTSLAEYPCEEKETCLYLLSGDFSYDAFAHHLPFLRTADAQKVQIVV